MRKITFGLMGLLMSVGAFAQTYSTGTVSFFTGGPTAAYSGKIDVTASTVTLTLIGPSTAWLGMGFNATGMNNIGADVVIFDGTNMTDRTFDGVGFEPILDATQNWTVNSNIITSGVRTVVATRARDTGDSNDYVFPAAAQAINVVYARRLGSLVVAYHGSGNCGATTVNLTLGLDSFNIDNFKMFPNPTKNFVSIELPQMVYEANVVIYDMLGKKVKEANVTVDSNKVDLSGLNSGSYLMKIKTADGEGTKTLVIN
jgi:type IX secretion system substrate protein